MTDIDRLVDLMQRVHGGDAWHGPSVMAALEGVTAATAAAHPAGSVHSIREIVAHLTAWRREVARRAGGANARDPVEGDWPVLPDPTDANWSAALEALQRSHEEVVTAVRSLTPGQLDRRVGDDRDRELGTGVSLYVHLHGLVHHDAYHAGQISLLKKIAGG